MKRKKSEAVEWLEFDLLSGIPGLFHGVFLRHGGVSKGPYTSLNAGGGSADDPSSISENLKRIQACAEVERLIGCHQCHGVEVARVSATTPPFIEACDGLITQEEEMGLVTRHADCQAALIYDPVHRAIANIHCGWRGNVQNIYAHAVAKMRAEFDSQPKDLLVGISPSLGPEASEFKNYREELPDSFLAFQIKPTYFDLWEIARDQLTKLGILPEHLEIAAISTYAHPEDFFSYRRDKETGRHASVITLKRVSTKQRKILRG
jgi:polyphenol oxidase